MIGVVANEKGFLSGLMNRHCLVRLQTATTNSLTKTRSYIMILYILTATVAAFYLYKIFRLAS